MPPENEQEFRPYDRIEIELMDYNTEKYVTYKGYFIRYNRGKVIIQVNSVFLNVYISRIRKVSNDKD